jgi:hypothetical protein
LHDGLHTSSSLGRSTGVLRDVAHSLECGFFSFFVGHLRYFVDTAHSSDHSTAVGIGYGLLRNGLPTRLLACDRRLDCFPGSGDLFVEGLVRSLEWSGAFVGITRNEGALSCFGRSCREWRRSVEQCCKVHFTKSRLLCLSRDDCGQSCDQQKKKGKSFQHGLHEVLSDGNLNLAGPQEFGHFTPEQGRIGEIASGSKIRIGENARDAV